MHWGLVSHWQKIFSSLGSRGELKIIYPLSETSVCVCTAKGSKHHFTSGERRWTGFNPFWYEALVLFLKTYCDAFCSRLYVQFLGGFYGLMMRSFSVFTSRMFGFDVLEKRADTFVWSGFDGFLLFYPIGPLKRRTLVDDWNQFRLMQINQHV